MAIAYDATSQIAVTNWGTLSRTVSHTTSGTNRVLFLAVFVTEYNTYSINTPTYNGVAMTYIGTASDPLNHRSNVLYYYLVNPAIGANNISVSFNSMGSSHWWSAVAVSLTGVHQTLPIDVSGSNTTGGAKTLALSLTTNYANSFIVHAILKNNSYGITIGQGTSLGNYEINGDIAARGYLATTTAGAKTVSWSWGFSNCEAAIAGVAFREVPPLGPANLKSYNTNLKANIKSINTNLIANVKSLNTNV